MAHALFLLVWIHSRHDSASHAFHQRIWILGAQPAIPFEFNEVPLACPDWTFNICNTFELPLIPATRQQQQKIHARGCIL